MNDRQRRAENWHDFLWFAAFIVAVMAFSLYMDL